MFQRAVNTDISGFISRYGLRATLECLERCRSMSDRIAMFDLIYIHEGLLFALEV